MEKAIAKPMFFQAEQTSNPNGEPISGPKKSQKKKEKLPHVNGCVIALFVINLRNALMHSSSGLMHKRSGS